MAGLGWQELVIVLVIIMIIFGAGKLPEIAKSLGQGVKEFRSEANAPVVPERAASTGAAVGAHADVDAVAADAEAKIDEAADQVRADAARADTAVRDAI